MQTFSVSDEIADALALLYRDMELSYNRVARMLGFCCKGCEDNCCDSYFQHHTYIEWWYLWRGLSALSACERAAVEERSRRYLLEVQRFVNTDMRPQVMCPLNREGLCMLYSHRLLVCRTHGVPAQIHYPDGKKVSFPGCFRCQKQTNADQDPPYIDRTPLLVRMAALENRFLQGKRHLFSPVRQTIAEMILKGPPEQIPS